MRGWWRVAVAIGAAALMLIGTAWYTGPSGRWAGSGNPSPITVQMDGDSILTKSIIVVPCAINGHQTECMLDTGYGSGMVVSPPLAETLGLHPAKGGNFDWAAFSSPSDVQEGAPVDVTIAGRGGPVSAVVGNWGDAKSYAIIGLQAMAQVGSTINVDLLQGTVTFQG